MVQVRIIRRRENYILRSVINFFSMICISTLVGQDDPVRLPGALYGAKCGISDPENKPSSLHFLLTTLYNHNLVQAWVQHGHDGLPAQAGFPTHLCLEVYNSWFQAQIIQIEQEMS